MITIVLALALGIAIGLALAATIRARRLGQELRLERAENKRTVLYYRNRENSLTNANAFLKKSLENSYQCLEVAVGATPGPFNDVVTEIGIHGITYQFHAREEKEVS